MAVPPRAICTIRFPPANHMNNFEFNPNHQRKLRLKWAASIQNLFYTDQEPQDRNYLRNFDIVLNIDGSAENYFQDQSASSVSATLYPARYQLPEAISANLDTTEERIAKAELFALGSLLYEVVSGHHLVYELGESADDDRAIQELIAAGNFPEDLWDLPVTPKILVCFHAEFLQEMLSLRRTGIKHYIQKHPGRFTFQALGGIIAIASVITLPILGAVGFSAAGPVAGSAAAAWQSSIGLVEAGSIFAWCQSLAMGGAAVGGIIGAGVGGVGVLSGAMMLGVLDGEDFDREVLKERFLVAWRGLFGREDDSDR
ncbi:hypothetical protein EYC80_000608 [Monilinia laxa]|uniref:Protein kinase domain-containing protein n=1 Tax=Monilinia laxa TaxID=61186 RepID=A0A5N6KB81_MONLA|nr:hypothetical protein EYC80_000608 [Monilinia laxa]